MITRIDLSFLSIFAIRSTLKILNTLIILAFELILISFFVGGSFCVMSTIAKIIINKSRKVKASEKYTTGPRPTNLIKNSAMKTALKE